MLSKGLRSHCGYDFKSRSGFPWLVVIPLDQHHRHSSLTGDARPRFLGKPKEIGTGPSFTDYRSPGLVRRPNRSGCHCQRCLNSSRR
jgi:hypothetical protein